MRKSQQREYTCLYKFAPDNDQTTFRTVKVKAVDLFSAIERVKSLIQKRRPMGALTEIVCVLTRRDKTGRRPHA